MEKYIGKSARVNKPGTETHTRKCTIIKFDNDAGKYQVAFGDSWMGWYLAAELIIGQKTETR